MSEADIIQLARRIDDGLNLSYKRMLKQKLMFGESVIISDNMGYPCKISAQEALQRMNGEL